MSILTPNKIQTEICVKTCADPDSYKWTAEAVGNVFHQYVHLGLPSESTGRVFTEEPDILRPLSIHRCRQFLWQTSQGHAISVLIWEKAEDSWSFHHLSVLVSLHIPGLQKIAFAMRCLPTAKATSKAKEGETTAAVALLLT